MDEEDVDGAQVQPSELIFNPESQLRNWLTSRGKDHCIDFKDEEMR